MCVAVCIPPTLRTAGTLGSRQWRPAGPSRAVHKRLVSEALAGRPPRTSGCGNGHAAARSMPRRVIRMYDALIDTYDTIFRKPKGVRRPQRPYTAAGIMHSPHLRIAVARRWRGSGLRLCTCRRAWPRRGILKSSSNATECSRAPTLSTAEVVPLGTIVIIAVPRPQRRANVEASAQGAGGSSCTRGRQATAFPLVSEALAPHQ